MPRTVAWPTRDQWQAEAERAERTSRAALTRVSSDPAEWLTPEELTEARRLAAAVVRQARKALVTTGNVAHRPTLNEHGREAATDHAEVIDLTYAWWSILRIAAEQGNLSTPETERLRAVHTDLSAKHRQAAQAAEDEAVRRAVEYRATEEAWQEELTRRARVERGPQVTVITVHGDGTSTVSDPRPYEPPAPPRRRR
ncbi:hypothetical protein ACFC58_06150 [Kitasatospora purpeofusca]|uniref:hypothetical protein n=1 Tax=Kitasatospora purpeofusca TaxID=67352 RepID=UPI0035DA8A2C